MIPLGLYVHFPWCIKKCPYCDFNSHELDGDLAEEEYVATLLDDLRKDAPLFKRPIDSIFFGGGTPSLFSPHSFDQFLTKAQCLLPFNQKAEITLEVNPGALDTPHLYGYRQAGINRLSLGVQSFNGQHLKSLGRIHNLDDITRTIGAARSAGFDNINFDLMHGLPNQNWADAKTDLMQAIAYEPEHISWYQLTLEPNTVFYRYPPVLPSEATLLEIYDKGMELLARHGYQRYEISAFCQSNRQSKHNLNYWRFGDYIGIGSGAHGKYTTGQKVFRTTKTRLPRDYLKDTNKKTTLVPGSELLLEYLINALRLVGGTNLHNFEDRTGLPRNAIENFLQKAKDMDFIEDFTDEIVPTQKGLRFVDEALLLLD